MSAPETPVQETAQPLTPEQAERFVDLYNHYGDSLLQHAAERVGGEKAIEVVEDTFRAAQDPHKKVREYLRSPNTKLYYQPREWLWAAVCYRLRKLERAKIQSEATQAATEAQHIS